MKLGIEFEDERRKKLLANEQEFQRQRDLEERLLREENQIRAHNQSADIT